MADTARQIVGAGRSHPTRQMAEAYDAAQIAAAWEERKHSRRPAKEALVQIREELGL